MPEEEFVTVATLNLKQKSLFLGQLALLTIVLWAGICSFWTDSEMWNVVVAQHLFSGTGEYDFWVKPIFDFILYLNFQLAKGLSIHPMLTARVLFVGNALLCLYLFRRIAERLSRSPTLATFLCILLLGNSFFIKRFTNARSDLLVTCLFLSLILVRESGWWRRTPRIRVLLAGLVFALSYLITPKAIFLSAVWSWAYLRQDLRTLFRSRATWALTSTLAAAIALGFYNHNALRFFLDSFTLSDGLSYWDWQRLEHLTRAFKENPILIFLTLFNFMLWRKAHALPDVGPHFTFTNWTLLFLMVYPDRLPFFIASLLPFWFVPMSAYWPHLQMNAYYRKHNWSRLTAMLLIFSVSSCLYWSTFLIFFHNSVDQRKFIAWLQQQEVPLRDLEVFDPVGVLPFSPTAHHWYLGPAEAGNEIVLKNLREHSVDVLIFTTKLQFLGLPLREYLMQNYWQDQAGIFIRKFSHPLSGHRLKMDQLREILETDFPFLQRHPEHAIYVQMWAKTLDLSNYAAWHTQDGEAEPFTNRVMLDQLTKYERLVLPPTVDQITLLPVHMETPYSMSWSALFRFDSEI